jgi:hypothetical protein
VRMQITDFTIIIIVIISSISQLWIPTFLRYTYRAVLHTVWDRSHRRGLASASALITPEWHTLLMHYKNITLFFISKC